MRYAVALSGGADSLCAAALMPTGVALIVDHGLRPGSGREAARAAALAREMGHDARILPLRWPRAPRSQAAYRHARYRALALACQDHGIDQLWTGHHRDDQAETVLMRLSQDSGLLGLSGMPVARPFASTWLVRPLLTTSRAEIEAWLRARRIDWVHDPSNADPAYLRARARAYLRHHPAAHARLIDLATRAGDLRARLIAEGLKAAPTLTAPSLLELPRAALTALSPPALREVLRACLRWLGGRAYPATQAHEALVHHGRVGQRATAGGVVMERGAAFRLAPEERETQETPVKKSACRLSLDDLAARAAPRRAAQTQGRLWLPQGRRTLAAVGPAPCLKRLYVTADMPCPLAAIPPQAKAKPQTKTRSENGPWIEFLRDPPMYGLELSEPA